jgi:hypothetical protein
MRKGPTATRCTGRDGAASADPITTSPPGTSTSSARSRGSPRRASSLHDGDQRLHQPRHRARLDLRRQQRAGIAGADQAGGQRRGDGGIGGDDVAERGRQARPFLQEAQRKHRGARILQHPRFQQRPHEAGIKQIGLGRRSANQQRVPQHRRAGRRDAEALRDGEVARQREERTAQRLRQMRPLRRQQRQKPVAAEPLRQHPGARDLWIRHQQRAQAGPRGDGIRQRRVIRVIHQQQGAGRQRFQRQARCPGHRRRGRCLPGLRLREPFLVPHHRRGIGRRAGGEARDVMQHRGAAAAGRRQQQQQRRLRRQFQRGAMHRRGPRRRAAAQALRRAVLLRPVREERDHVKSFATSGLWKRWTSIA